MHKIRALDEVRMAIEEHQANNRGDRPSSIEIPWPMYKEIMIDPINEGKSELNTIDGVPVKIADYRHAKESTGNRSNNNDHNMKIRMHKIT